LILVLMTLPPQARILAFSRGRSGLWSTVNTLCLTSGEAKEGASSTLLAVDTAAAARAGLLPPAAALAVSTGTGFPVSVDAALAAAS
jgi:hypothetical protein